MRWATGTLSPVMAAGGLALGLLKAVAGGADPKGVLVSGVGDAGLSPLRPTSAASAYLVRAWPGGGFVVNDGIAAVVVHPANEGEPRRFPTDPAFAAGTHAMGNILVSSSGKWVLCVADGGSTASLIDTMSDSAGPIEMPFADRAFDLRALFTDEVLYLRTGASSLTWALAPGDGGFEASSLLKARLLSPPWARAVDTATRADCVDAAERAHAADATQYADVAISGPRGNPRVAVLEVSTNSPETVLRRWALPEAPEREHRGG